MNVYTLDFETYFDKRDYTLRKMTTEAYIRDQRFQAHLLGVQHPDGKKEWVGHEDIPDFLAGIDWSKVAILAHHAHFDGLILGHHYGVRPALWLDTLCMARLMVGNHLSVGLESLANHFGLSPKSVPYDRFDGKRWEELSWETRDALGDGCLHDVDLTWEIFQRLMNGFPAEELGIIDQTTRMFTEPCIVGDAAALDTIAVEEFTSKNDQLLALGVSKEDLQSAQTFIGLLQVEGVEIEWKDGTNGPIPAIAKTDDFMRSLQDHPNPRVAALTEARLSVRSTINETRAARLADTARRGPMPVYLNYCGAHTTRWSGGDKVNWQNFGRGSQLGAAMHAPEGYDFGIADASQQECRFLNMVAGQWDVIEHFRRREDPYVPIASQFYGHEVYKPARDDPRKDEMEAKRGMGKQLELSCGYGAGALTIQVTAKAGTYGPPVHITEQEALRARDLYRETHPQVTNLWRQGDDVLAFLARQTTSEEGVWGPFKLRPGCIVLPNGAPMWYRLRWDKDERAWMRRTRRGEMRIWGGFLVENCMQALGRVHISQAMLRIKTQGVRIVCSRHDDLTFLLKRDLLQAETFDRVVAELKRPPSWLPDIPLDAEGVITPVFKK